MKRFILTVAVILLAYIVVADAQIPQTISYQGVLTNIDGKFIADGHYKITLNLYDGLNAKEVLYSETQDVVVIKGLFNVFIGSVTPLPSTLTFDRAYFLGVSVNGAEEMQPRTALTTSPYAFRAQSAAEADVAKGLSANASGAVTSVNNANGNLVLQGSGSTKVSTEGNVITISTDESKLTTAGGTSKGNSLMTTPSGPAGGDLMGTYPNPYIGNSKITNAKLAYASVGTGNIIDGNVTLPKINTVGSSTGKAVMYNGSSVVWGNPYPAGPAGGDLSGTYPNPQIAAGVIVNADVNAAAAIAYSKLNLNNSIVTSDLTNGSVTLPKISSAGAGTDQVIKFDGSNIVWGDGFILPYANTVNSASTLFDITQTGSGSSGRFAISNAGNTSAALVATTNGIGNGVTVQLTNASNGARGVDVLQAGVGPGVFATSAGGNAVWGITSSISAAGVIGDNTFGEAVVGRNRGGNGVGAVVGRNDSSGYGVRGFNTKDGIGVLGQSGISGGTGQAGRFENVNAANTTTTLNVATNGIGGGIGVSLTNASNGARGVDVNQAGVGPGVFATSAGGNAVWGITSSISAAGVIGDNTFGEAVVGRNRGGNGVGAVVGRNDSSGYGVRGFNTKDGIGVLGQAGISGGTGVGGRFENVNAANTSSALQVATNGIGNGIEVDLPNASNGARGIDVTQAGVGPGVFATSAGGNALWGITSSISAAGVIGDNTFGEAVVGRNRGGNGVGAVVGRNDSSGYGVRGFNTKNGYGVLGQAGISGGTGTAGRFENVNAANTSDALQVVTNSSGNAARFTGNVVVNGNLTVSGTVAKGGGSFKIDHPLDPANKILFHSFVESPDMKDINDGIAILDANGEAWVELPNWYEALNKDFRYQLTAIGAQAPGLYIAEEIKDNRFKIAGGKPGMKISWQVTGIRHDPYAEKHRIQVEVDKKPEERGTYIHPDVYVP